MKGLGQEIKKRIGIEAADIESSIRVESIMSAFRQLFVGCTTPS